MKHAYHLVVIFQGKVVKKDFNIEDEVGIRRPLAVPFNASVINNTLEIRFYWAGKGTTRFPKRGRYGPLVSAISVNPCELYLIFHVLTAIYTDKFCL